MRERTNGSGRTEKSLFTVNISDKGRIVIRAEIRRLMEIRPGDQLLLSFHDGELHIATRKQRLQQAKDIVRSCVGKVSLADELIAERRLENQE